MALYRTSLSRRGSKNESSRNDDEIDNNSYVQVLVKPLYRGNLLTVLADICGVGDSNLAENQNVGVFYGVAFLALSFVIFQICDMGIFFQRLCSVLVPMFTVVCAFYWLSMYLRKTWSTTSVYILFCSCVVGETLAQIVFGRSRYETSAVPEEGYLSRPIILFIVLVSICIASVSSSLETIHNALVLSLVSFSRFLVCSSIGFVPYGLRPYLAYICGLVGYIVSKYMETVLKPPIYNFMTHDGRIPVIKCRRSSTSTTHSVSAHRSTRRISLPALIPKNQGLCDHGTMVRGCSAYVCQDDRLLPHLTVKETLMFVAQLKLPTTFTSEQIKKRVESVINELGLSHVADSKVGGAEDRGVSGGERRRVSIGVQLLLDPSILFLDEPTSGLDSFTAHHLVETLARLAKNNRAVLLSIHQPRSDIFELFDMVLILSKGDMAYFGQASYMMSYFNTLGYPCPEFTNPCDFYVDLATVDPTSAETEHVSSAMVQKLVDAYKDSQKDLSGSSSVKAEREEKNKEQWPLLAMFKNLENQPGPLWQFWILFRRSTRNIFEDYGYLASQFIQAVAMSVVFGLVYFNLGLDQSGVRDRFGMMYILGALYPYMVVLDLIGIYHKERSFLYFELEDRLYGVGPYYFAKICSELPFHTFYVAVYCVPVYFIAGLTRNVHDFMIVFAILFLLVYCSRTLAMFAASMMLTFQLSCFFAQTFFSMYIMSAGFFINLNNIFDGLKWVSSLSYLKWGFQALCKVQIADLRFTCDNDGAPCISTGDQALESYSLQGDTIWKACIIMTSSCIIYLILFFIGMRFVSQKPHEI